MGTGWNAKGVYNNLLFITVANITCIISLKGGKVHLVHSSSISACLIYGLVVFGPMVRGEDKGGFLTRSAPSCAKAIAPGLGAF